MQKNIKISSLVLILLFAGIIAYHPANKVSGQTPEEPFLPTVGGAEFPVLVSGDSVYFLDIDIIDAGNLELGVLPSNLGIKGYRYNLPPGQQTGTWENVTIENQVPLRAGYAACAQNDKLYFFGGSVINPSDPATDLVYADLHHFEVDSADPSLGRFIKHNPTSSYTPPPTVGSKCYLEGNTLKIVNGTIIDTSTGEPTAAPNYAVNNFDLTSEAWELSTTQSVETPFTALESISDAIMWKEGSNLYVLGEGQDGRFAVWTDQGGQWNDITPTTSPTYKDGYSYVQDPSGAMFIYGGVDSSDVYDSELYRIQNGAFSIMIPTNAPPPPRTEAKMVYYQNKIFMFGGFNDELYTEMGNDVWSFDLNSRQWSDHTVLPPAPIVPPGDISPDGPEDYFTGDIEVSAHIKTRTRVEGKKRKCSITGKKKRDKIYGNSRTNIVFLYGDDEGMTIDTDPIITYSKDNRLTFDADIDSGDSDRRIIKAFWEVEGRGGFGGFDDNFFDDLIEPIDEWYVTDPNDEEGAPRIKLDQSLIDSVKTATPMANDSTFERGSYSSKGGGDLSKKRVAFSETFPPGKHRVHLTAIATDPDLAQQTIEYNYSSNLKVKACGKTFDVPPSVSATPDNRVLYYYITYVFEFDVPEIVNFNDIISVDESQPYMEEGFMRKHNDQPPNLVNSFRPVFYGHLTTPGSEIIPYMGKVNYRKYSKDILLIPLNDDPFGEMSDVYEGTEGRLHLYADNGGNFSFQPLNILPYNAPGKRGIPQYYDLRVLTIDDEQNIIGIPPVKVASVAERIYPRIFNYKDTETISVPKPVFIGGYIPNRKILISKDNKDFVVVTDAEGNFRFNLPDPFSEGANTFDMIDFEDPSFKRNFQVTLSSGTNISNPQFTNILANNSIPTNLPVFNGTYKANATLSYIYDEGLSSEDSGTISTDENGHFVVENIFLQGDLSAPESKGLHSLRVYEGSKQARVDFRIQEKDQSVGENASIKIIRQNGIVNVLNGGEISVDNSMRLFLNAGDTIKVLSPSTQMYVPAGGTIYRNTNGLRETVVSAGVFTLDENDFVILPYRGGVIWVEESGQKDLLVPANTIISAYQADAEFTYIQGGWIMSSDQVEVDGELRDDVNLHNYFVQPQYDRVSIINYKNGDVILSKNPVFLGMATPNSIIEVWRQKTRSKEKMSDYEHVIATTPVDSRGRFEIKATTPMEENTEYEYAFVNRGQQAPAYRVNLITASSLSDDENVDPYNEPSDYPYANTNLEPARNQLLLKRMPTMWGYKIWNF